MLKRLLSVESLRHLRGFLFQVVAPLSPSVPVLVPQSSFLAQAPVSIPVLLCDFSLALGTCCCCCAQAFPVQAFRAPAPVPSTTAAIARGGGLHTLVSYSEPTVLCRACGYCGPSTQTGFGECAGCKLCEACCGKNQTCPTVRFFQRIPSLTLVCRCPTMKCLCLLLPPAACPSIRAHAIKLHWAVSQVSVVSPMGSIPEHWPPGVHRLSPV